MEFGFTKRHIVMKQFFFLIGFIVTSSIHLFAVNEDSIRISISIDNVHLTDLHFGSDRDLDSSFILPNSTVELNWNSRCDSKINISFKGMVYYLTISSDLISYSNSIHINIESVKETGKKDKVFYYSEKSGQLSIGARGVASKIREIPQ